MDNTRSLNSGLTAELCARVEAGRVRMLRPACWHSATLTGGHFWTKPATTDLSAQTFYRAEFRVQYKPRGRYAYAALDFAA